VGYDGIVSYPLYGDRIDRFGDIYIIGYYHGKTLDITYQPNMNDVFSRSNGGLIKCSAI
jgi:hypothetical protein